MYLTVFQSHAGAGPDRLEHAGSRLTMSSRCGFRAARQVGMTVSCECPATTQPNRPKWTMLQRIMTIEIPAGAPLSDAELLLEVRRLAGHERQATARLIAALGELDARRLYLGQGCSSLFTFCTQILHLSEHAA